MSEDLPEPIPLQAGSIPINTFDAGTTAGDIITWTGTEWVSAPGGGGGAPSIAGTANQIDTNGAIISLDSDIIIPNWQTYDLKASQLLSVISTTALSIPNVNTGCFISIGSLNYSSGTASQAGNTITGSGTTFTSSMIGLPFIFTNNTNVCYITSVNSATSLTVSYSQNVSSQTYGIYNLIYNVNNVNTSLNGTIDSKVGVGTIAPANIFSAMPINTTLSFPGTVSQALNTVTGVGTNFTSSMLNMHIVYLNGTYGGIITSIASTTQMTVSTSQTVASTRYTLHYPGFHVNYTGQSLISGKIFGSETVRTSGIISNSLDTIFEPISALSCSLTDAIDNQYKIVRLKMRNSMPVTITCPMGTFDLDPNNDMRKLRYDGSVGYWEIEGGNSLNKPCPLSFYPTRQFGVALESSIPPSPSAQSGRAAISSDGSVLVLGAADLDISGTVIFTRTGSSWTQQGPMLFGTGGVTPFIYQGMAVAISADGKTVAVGGPQDNDNIGAVWIFVNNNGTWSQQGPKLVGTGYVGGINSLQGTSVSLSTDGNTLAVGGPQDNDSIGATWVFTRTGTVWTQQGAKLVGTGYIGSTISQGYSVSLSGNGNILAIGSYYFETDEGGVWIFTRSGTTWTQQGSKLTANDATGRNAFGASVSLSLDGTVFAAGAPFDNLDTGATWIFTYNNGSWSQFGSKLIGQNIPSPGGFQGNAVALSPDGSTLATAPGDGSGVAIFTGTTGRWVQKSVLVATYSVPPYIGISLAFSSNGNLLAVGGGYSNDQFQTKPSAWLFT
jgi:hypothetical protein